MVDEREVHSILYQVLDGFTVRQSAPAADRGTINSIVDRLRSHCPMSDDCRRAELISVEMHKLELALRSGDNQAEWASRQNLTNLARDLLNMRIAGRARSPVRVQGRGVSRCS